MALITKYPNLSESLVLIHKTITRGLSTAISRGTEFLRSGFPEQTVWEGYLDFVRSLATVLDSHHATEDEIIFPSIVSKMPEVPYARLMADHRKIASLLDKVNAKITSLSSGSTADDLKSMIDIWQEIFSMWNPHIQIEEQEFAEDILMVTVNQPEQKRIMNAISKHNQEHALPPELIIPFVLFNLEGADRALMSATFPQTIIDDLIPKVWKGRWAPMQPFLLS
jgi:hemerythrin-like domain-containing protein